MSTANGSTTDGRGDVLPFAAREVTLPNGLRVIVVPTGLPNLVSLQIPVQTGSRNEVEAGKSGFAHFFEHMMFRGTPDHPPAVYQEIMTRAGARQNAYTTDDYTNYHVTFAAEDIETVLALEADRFMHLAYSEEDFKTEAHAILGEYNKSAVNPLLKLFEVQREHAFTVHPYQHTTMGFLRDIEAMPEQYEYSRTFFQRWYRPEYTSLIVAGDVDPDRVLALVERYWGGWRGGEGGAVAIPQEPPPRGPVVARVPWSSPTLPWVTVAFHAPAFSVTEQDFAALQLLLDLAFGETSELYRRLVEEEQVVDRLDTSYPAAVDPPLATILARVKREEDTASVRDAILETVEASRRTAPEPRRVRDAQAHGRYSFARTLDTSESVAATLARYVRFERSYNTVNALYRRYDALTPDDLLAAARRYLAPERLVQTTLAHTALPPAIETVPVARPPEPATNSPAAGPVWLVLPSPAPLLRIKLLFTVGSAHDPAGREGLAALSAAMVAQAGSEQLPIDAINKALFPIAGSFEERVDRELTVFTGAIHRDNAQRFAEIVLPQLLQPGMRVSDFERLRRIQHNALVQDLRANNDEELGKERLQANVFADTPYGHPPEGTVAGIEAITFEDVKAFVARVYTRASLTIGLGGDVPEEFRALLERELAKLPAGEPLALPPFSGRRPRGIEVEIVEKDTPATAISFGFPIEVTRPHPDFAPLWLARAWLGEHRASNGRLFQRLRELRGLNYGDYAYIEAFPVGSPGTELEFAL